MKIIDVKTIVVGNRWKNWVFLKLVTDEGIEGLGEATSGLITMPVVSMVQEVAHLCIGHDPTCIEKLNTHLIQSLFLNESEAFWNVLSGINIACWDILGKKLKVPLYQLLGGKARPAVRAYANGWYQVAREPEQFAQRAKIVVEMGYTAIKFDPFGSAYGFLSNFEERISMEIVRAVREAVGWDVDIMVEGHDRLSLPAAKRIGILLEPYAPMWYETPCMSSDIEGTNEIARNIKVPVATGERFITLRDFKNLLAERAVGIVQPEALAVGGVSGLLAVAALARGFDAWVAPHNAQSPLTTAISTHVGITLPNLLIQECFDDFADDWVKDLLHGYPKVVDGHLIPIDAPGHGVTIDEQVAAKFPYSPNNFMRMFEPRWEKRNIMDAEE